MVAFFNIHIKLFFNEQCSKKKQRFKWGCQKEEFEND